MTTRLATSPYVEISSGTQANFMGGCLKDYVYIFPSSPPLQSVFVLLMFFLFMF